MGGNTNGNNNGNNGNQNNQNGLAGFGFGGQQVPSEIVNLNNAFGTGGGGGAGSGGNNNQNNNGIGNLNDILNQFGTPNTAAAASNPNNDIMGNLGSSSSTDVNEIFPFL